MPRAYIDDPSDMVADVEEVTSTLLFSTTEEEEETKPGTTLLTEPTMSETPLCRTNTKLSVCSVVKRIVLSSVPPIPMSKSSASRLVHPSSAKLSYGNDNHIGLTQLLTRWGTLLSTTSEVAIARKQNVNIPNVENRSTTARYLLLVLVVNNLKCDIPCIAASPM